MRHYPLFLDLRGRKVVVVGAGAAAEAKLRLLLKTEAELLVFGTGPKAAVRRWADAGRIALFERDVEADDVAGAAPSVPIATVTGSRSTIAGVMKSLSSRLSTRLTRTPAALASSATRASARASPAAP